MPPLPPMVRRTIVQPQTRPKSGIVKSKSSKQDLSAMNSSGHLSGNDSQKASDTSSRSIKDRFCVFCDEKSSAFTDEGLVTHYWSDCAMLANCPNCKIVSVDSFGTASGQCSPSCTYLISVCNFRSSRFLL